MVNFFITQNAAVQFFVLLIHALLVLAASTVCMHWLGTRLRGRSDMLPVAPYFVSVTTVFALFLAFHASTIWSRQHATEAAFHDAVTAISRLDALFGEKVWDSMTPESTCRAIPKQWFAKSGRLATPNRAPRLTRSLSNYVKS